MSLRAELGYHRLRRSRTLCVSNKAPKDALFRLPCARSSFWAGRRHGLSGSSCGVASVRAGDCAADDRVFPENGGWETCLVWIRRFIQSYVRSINSPGFLAIGASIWLKPRPVDHDDRKFPVWPDLAPDAKMSADQKRTTARRVFRGMPIVRDQVAAKRRLLQKSDQGRYPKAQSPTYRAAIASSVASRKMRNPQLIRDAGVSELASPPGFEPIVTYEAKLLGNVDLVED